MKKLPNLPSLEINLFNDGIASFEVADNGTGIPLGSLDSLGIIVGFGL